MDEMVVLVTMAMGVVVVVTSGMLMMTVTCGRLE